MALKAYLQNALGAGKSSPLPDPLGEPLSDQNILGYDRSGNLQWIIEAVRPGSPYLDISECDEGVRFRNWDSCQGELDPSTGEIIDSYFAK